MTEETTTTKASSLPKGRYIEAIGRRKTASARVRISESGRSSVTINGKSIADYFPTTALQTIVGDATKKADIAQKFSISVRVIGGGMSSQAEAIRLGIARALVEYDAQLRTGLKHAGYLKRDPRVKERRKFGLKKARKSSQWSKR